MSNKEHIKRLLLERKKFMHEESIQILKESLNIYTQRLNECMKIIEKFDIYMSHVLSVPDEKTAEYCYKQMLNEKRQHEDRIARTNSAIVSSKNQLAIEESSLKKLNLSDELMQKNIFLNFE